MLDTLHTFELQSRFAQEERTKPDQTRERTTDHHEPVAATRRLITDKYIIQREVTW